MNALEAVIRHGNMMVVPYVRGSGIHNDLALSVIYNRLKSEGLWEIVFHDNPAMDLHDLYAFFARPTTLAATMAIVENDEFKDIAGMAWLADTVCCNAKLNRGEASFFFFRDYQKPQYTIPFGHMVLDYWFSVLGMDTIVGLTPSVNRTAMIYAARLGFEKVGTIPSYTTLGDVDDAVITVMTKKRYSDVRQSWAKGK